MCVLFKLCYTQILQSDGLTFLQHVQPNNSNIGFVTSISVYIVSRQDKTRCVVLLLLLCVHVCVCVCACCVALGVCAGVSMSACV